MNKTVVLLLVLSVGCMATGQLYAQALKTMVDQVVYDHCGEPFREDSQFGKPWGAHEGLLHGVPSDYDWYQGARPDVWFQTDTNEAVSTWGQVYEWENESPVTDVRIQIRNHMLYAYANSEWVVLEDGVKSGLQCSEWAEDFTESYGNLEGRVEASRGGGQSFPLTSGRNLHWWVENWPRANIPEECKAFFITCELRLIHGADSTKDISKARYLAGVSADAYPTDSSYGPGPWPSLSISRHKFVTPQWQTFTAYIAGQKPNTVKEYRKEILSRPLPPGVVTERRHGKALNSTTDTHLLKPYAFNPEQSIRANGSKPILNWMETVYRE